MICCSPQNIKKAHFVLHHAEISSLFTSCIAVHINLNRRNLGWHFGRRNVSFHVSFSSGLFSKLYTNRNPAALVTKSELGLAMATSSSTLSRCANCVDTINHKIFQCSKWQKEKKMGGKRNDAHAMKRRQLFKAALHASSSTQCSICDSACRKHPEPSMAQYITYLHTRRGHATFIYKLYKVSEALLEQTPHFITSARRAPSWKGASFRSRSHDATSAPREMCRVDKYSGSTLKHAQH